MNIDKLREQLDINNKELVIKGLDKLQELKTIRIPN